MDDNQYTEQQYTDCQATPRLPRWTVEKATRLGHQGRRPVGRTDVPTKDPQKSALPPMRLVDVYEAPGHLIRRSQQIAVAIFFDEFVDYDVTPVQYGALIAIRDLPGIDQRTLADQVAIDRSTIATVLKTLEERGHILRIAPKQNLRIKQLFITRAGENLLRSTREHIYRVQERILTPLSLKERKVFMGFLSRLVRNNNEFSRAPLKVVSSED
jgi:MarR family transcriptional regulator, lower aerobic nicotinate degradation pathway regulator